MLILSRLAMLTLIGLSELDCTYLSLNDKTSLRLTATGAVSLAYSLLE
jgi:hypothetical protein